MRDAWGHRFVQQRGCEKCVRDYVARCTANGGAITAEPWALPVEAR